ncbi:MAG: class I SAM-dependent methyltransferase [Trebonia sp.]
MSGIYEEPELYELACAYRDIPAEASALQSWCATHLTGDAGAAGVRSVLELAAGPGEHVRELARRGLRATALDWSPAMCAYAAGQAKAAGVTLDVVEADMRDFRVAGPDGARVRFDVAVTMLNSVCHLFTLEDLVRHLTAVRAHLVPGGLYIVELAHPADVFAPEPRTSSEWTVDAPGVHADVHWGGRGDRIDPLTQVTNEHMSITATAADGTIRTVSDVVPNRFWTLTEFTAAIALANAAPPPAPARQTPTGSFALSSASIEAKSATEPDPPGGFEPDPPGGFELVATYGDFDDTTPLDAPTAWRMILILRRP